MKKYAFWNNKGGTGKTSLSFQSICRYAELNPKEEILVIDVCPQANLSELLLGGLMGKGSDHLLARQAQPVRATLGGYFQSRLPTPYQKPAINGTDFLTRPIDYNANIPANISLICGDPLLELQSNAINTLASQQIPGTNTWVSIIDWVNDLIDSLDGKYVTLFIDCNPSFSIYTQIALAAVNGLILPVMADDSSRRAIQNAFSLIYGLKLPSEIYATYAFANKLIAAKRELPKVHLIVKNRITQYMGPASAYAAVLNSIDRDIEQLLLTHGEIFTFPAIKDGVVDIKDFQTTGVVSFAKGCPFSTLPSGRISVMGKRVRVNNPYRESCLQAIDVLVGKL
ncbi:ParA family protein [Yersinia mollaretii]|uniref:ParA family protein n=1 Tax=Yersinia mollaretii TaxID=33060 RepID=UPI0005E54B27|nr:ParA family protein [Yersinia mollaretii]CNJ52001.1 CobQ/CobB/MinD/ParA nucleotide binding domain [Yersinia mollaretii]CNL45024.1 CobQ/CobB/MinD/ParA nucleotide binding domain [Yersinia enterocolitica]